MTGDHIAAIRADAKRAADLLANIPPEFVGVLPSVPLLGSLAGNAELACDEVERLTARVAELEATRCEKPGAASCAKQWEADHQRTALTFHGLDAEFPGGCDAISDVAAVLVATRDRVAELEAALRPFAVMASEDGLTPDDGVHLCPLDYWGTSATVGDLRRAASLLGSAS